MQYIPEVNQTLINNSIFHYPVNWLAFSILPS